MTQDRSPTEIYYDQLELYNLVSFSTVIKSAYRTLFRLDLEKIMDYASEKGASSWISVVLLREYFFICISPLLGMLVYKWEPSCLFSSTVVLVFVTPFTVERSLSCPHGGLLLNLAI